MKSNQLNGNTKFSLNNLEAKVLSKFQDFSHYIL